MDLNEEQKKWASKRRHGIAPKDLRSKLLDQECKCAFSRVEMIFDISERTPDKDGKGCHPLSPAIDHTSPGNPNEFKIVCYDLNDFKGCLTLKPNPGGY
jgi:hypothetical protein